MTRRRTPYRVVQQHHISHDPEITCLVFRSEHDAVTKLNRLEKSNPSQVFLELVEGWLLWMRQKIKDRLIGPYSQDMMTHLRDENMGIKAECRKQKKLRVRRSK